MCCLQNSRHVNQASIFMTPFGLSSLKMLGWVGFQSISISLLFIARSGQLFLTVKFRLRASPTVISKWSLRFFFCCDSSFGRVIHPGKLIALPSCAVSSAKVGIARNGDNRKRKAREIHNICHCRTRLDLPFRFPFCTIRVPGHFSPLDFWSSPSVAKAVKL